MKQLLNSIIIKAVSYTHLDVYKRQELMKTTEEMTVAMREMIWLSLIHI